MVVDLIIQINHLSFQHQSRLNNSNGNNELEQDLSKILNKNSLINGKASEMVSSGNF